jgi:hypothetical protein
MKVKTFVIGTINGVSDTFKKLDDLVNELECAEIIEINDTLYPADIQENRVPTIARRVIYEPTKEQVKEKSTL